MKFFQTVFGGGPFFIIIAAIIWSFDGILRRNLYVLPPATIVFYEHLLGAIILLPILIKKFPEIKKMTRKEWFSISFVALFSGAVGTIFYTAALGMVHFIQFSVVVLLQQLQPIWAILTARILLKEKLSAKFAVWAILGILSAYLITFKNLTVNLNNDLPTIIAAVLALLAGVVWAVSTSFSKIVLNKVSFWTATGMRFWLAPIFALIIILIQKNSPSLFQITSSQWMTLLTITFSTGMVALVIYYFGLRKTPARVSAICELAWPASAIFIDYFLFKQFLTVTQIIGVIILFISMYNVSKFKK